MDNATLIEMVFDRKQLWDVRDHNYHNRDLSRKLWIEIANQLQCTSHVAKTKWQNLRDTYRKEYMKLVRAGGTRKSSHWKYFQKLNFLNDVIALRKKPAFSTGKRSSTESIDGGYDDDAEFTDITPLRYLCEVPQIVEEETEDVPSKDVSDDASEDGTRRVHVEAEKARSAQSVIPCPLERIGVKGKGGARRRDEYRYGDDGRQDADSTDEDYHFVMSILPHLRDIPKRRKLYVRQKLQQILLDEQRRLASKGRRTRKHVSRVRDATKSEWSDCEIDEKCSKSEPEKEDRAGGKAGLESDTPQTVERIKTEVSDNDKDSVYIVNNQ